MISVFVRGMGSAESDYCCCGDHQDDDDDHLFCDAHSDPGTRIPPAEWGRQAGGRRPGHFMRPGWSKRMPSYTAAPIGQECLPRKIAYHTPPAGLRRMEPQATTDVLAPVCSGWPRTRPSSLSGQCSAGSGPSCGYATAKFCALPLAGRAACGHMERNRLKLSTPSLRGTAR